jgi:hypothetical protein
VEKCKAAAAPKTPRGRPVSGGGAAAASAAAAAAPQQEALTPPGSAARPAAGEPAKVAGYNVAYVGNIAFEATTEDIKALFEGCEVTRIRLHTDRDTGRSKGYAHVHFETEAGLDRAVGQFNGASLHGRGVRVSYAQLKKGGV